MLERVDADSFHSQAWANGGGRTTELAAGPERDDWLWRISMAEVASDGAFSILPGVRRQLAPLDGTIELAFEDGTRRTLQRLEVLGFDGGQPIQCHLPDGPGRDFNLMLRGATEGSLVLRPLLGSMVLLPRAGCRWFVFVVGGTCRLSVGDRVLALDTGTAAWAAPAPGARVLIEGGGEIALVRLEQVCADTK